jgi:hypothetical protein
MSKLGIGEDSILFSRGDRPAVIEAHRAFEAQLAHTKDLIIALADHPHFTDDCGEYLATALELSAELQGVRQDGPEALYNKMVEMLEPDLDEWRGYPESEWISQILNYATDGIAPELVEWAMANGAKDGITE